MNKQNKTGKKLLSAIFAAMLVASAAIPAYAAPKITRTVPAQNTSGVTAGTSSVDSNNQQRSESGLILGSGASVQTTNTGLSLGSNSTAKPVGTIGQATGLRLGASKGTGVTGVKTSISVPSGTNKTPAKVTVPDSPTADELAEQSAASGKSTVATKISESEYKDRVEDIIDDYETAADKCEDMIDNNADRAKSEKTKLNSLKSKFSKFRALSVPSKFSESAALLKAGCSDMISAIQYAVEMADQIIADDRKGENNSDTIDRYDRKIAEKLSDAESNFSDGESEFDSEK